MNMGRRYLSNQIWYLHQMFSVWYYCEHIICYQITITMATRISLWISHSILDGGGQENLVVNSNKLQSPFAHANNSTHPLKCIKIFTSSLNSYYIYPNKSKNIHEAAVFFVNFCAIAEMQKYGERVKVKRPTKDKTKSWGDKHMMQRYLRSQTLYLIFFYL